MLKLAQAAIVAGMTGMVTYAVASQDKPQPFQLCSGTTPIGQRCISQRFPHCDLAAVGAACLTVKTAPAARVYVPLFTRVAPTVKVAPVAPTVKVAPVAPKSAHVRTEHRWLVEWNKTRAR